MNRIIAFLIFSSSIFILTSCSPVTPTISPEPIIVQYTAAAAPWLADLYACAGNNIVKAELRAADFLFPEAANLVMRIGQPAALTSPTYQVDTEDILVIVNTQNPLNKLTHEQVRGLFTGQTLNWKDIDGLDAPVQVWVYASGEDVQQIFSQTALSGSPVTSSARLTTGPNEMTQAVAGDVNAIGILTRHWKANDVSDVFTVTTVPVLAITPSEPRTDINNILACMQK